MYIHMYICISHYKKAWILENTIYVYHHIRQYKYRLVIQ